MPKRLTDYEASLRHQYRVEPGGPTVPGVTTVLNIVDKPALMWSAAQIAAQTANTEHRRKGTIVRRHRKTLTALGKKERELGYNGTDDEVFIHYCRGQFRREWDAKAERGTRVHAVAEAWTKAPGEPVDVRAEDSGFVDALEAFHRDYKPKFLLAEAVVLNPVHIYGGRFDAIVHTIEGTFLIDYKTGGHYEAALAMQQVAYMMAGEATFTSEGTLMGTSRPLMDVWKLDGARGIYLHEDGTYEVVDPFKNISQELAWEGFLACLKLYNTVKEMDRVMKEGK
jgi:hypothetical protein